MMSLIKKMNLKKVCLTVGCVLAVGLVSITESSAGAVPWTFNALFGPARNGPMYYGTAYGPAPSTYTTNYGGVPMAGATNTSFHGPVTTTSYYAPTTSYYGPTTTFYGQTMSRARARRSSRTAYRLYLLNNPQAVGVKYSSFAGGNSYQFAGAAYGPNCCSPCGMGGCSTGNCATGNCASGQCGVNYNSASASPTPDPNAGGKAPEPRVPQPRDVEETPPKTFADDPMPRTEAKPNVEDSGFNARSYENKPMPKSEEVDPFKTPLNREPMETPKPSSVPPADGFGPDTKKDDFFGEEKTKTDAFKVTPDGKLPKTTIPQKKAAPTKQPATEAPKAEKETSFPPLRVRPLNLDQKITWKSAPKAERLTIRAHFSAPVVAKQNVPANSGWFAITDSQKIASK